MSNGKRKKWRFAIWAILGLLLIGMVTLSWSPLTQKNPETGFVKFHWSGWKALFTGEYFGIKTDYYIETTLHGIDGPYVFIGDTLWSATVTDRNEIKKEVLAWDVPIIVQVPNKEHDTFSVPLRRDLGTTIDTFSAPAQLVAISDIEGNFNGFCSFLKNNDIIDSNFHWSFGNNHLVLVGDFVDRGQYVVQVLWLIYKLEEEARRSGGMVHFILGNHEVMNLEGRASYCHEKYINVAQKLSLQESWDKALSYLYSPRTELGRWLRTKNTIEKIGPYLFTHGGVSTNLAAKNLSINDINTIVRTYINREPPLREKSDERTQFVIGKEGPLWYRGLVTDYKDYRKETAEQVAALLNSFGCEKMAIGHSIVENVSTDYNGKLIRLDVLHGQEKGSGKTKGLLIENGVEYRIDDLGKKEKL